MTGTQEHPEWYPDFESTTGVSMSVVTAEDVQLYWSCKGLPLDPDIKEYCDGMEAPCGRSCGSSTVSKSPTEPIDNEDMGMKGSKMTANVWWYIIGAIGGILFVLCVVYVIYVCCCKKKAMAKHKRAGEQSETETFSEDSCSQSVW